jgi:phosphotransferase family enzyme
VTPASPDPAVAAEQVTVDEAEHVRVLLEGRRLFGTATVRAVLRVRPNPYGSRSSTLIVDVVTSDGDREGLLVKVGPVGERNPVGTPWGLGYEAVVYEGILTQISSLASPYLGHLVDAEQVWLVLRWVNDALPVTKAPYPSGIRSAAAWLGRFHREASALLDQPMARQLTRYPDIVTAWTERASANLVPLLSAGSSVLCALQDAVPAARSLLGEEQTLAHGDLYPANVLITGADVVAIDWEWAGIGAGELDLAALVERWPPATQVACASDYRRARWPAGDGQGFGARFAASRLFFALRWLGGNSIRSGDPEAEHYLGQLVEAVRELAPGRCRVALP